MQLTKPHSISVVIPNYNGRQLLEQNLPSVFTALKVNGCVYEVIVSDDASTDDSVSFLSEHYPDITLIQNKQNGGFATNINRGIFAATLDLVLLLNSDIKLGEDYFIAQLQFFELPDTFGVMGQIRDEETDSVVEACKYPIRSVFKINSFKNIMLKSDKPVYTYYLSGANALVDREKLLRLGGFNELFSPFYQEDLDLSLRAWENGWKCYFEQKSICRHAVSSTINKHNKKAYIKVINTRNKLILTYLHLRGIKLFLWIVSIVLSLPVRWAIKQSFYYPATRLFVQKLTDIRAYKTEFISASVNRGQYVSFQTIKKNIYTYLDQIIKTTE